MNDDTIRERDRLALGRLVLRQAHAQRLGMPSRVEVWRGAECVGFILGAQDAIEIVPSDGQRLAPDGGRVVLSLRVEFVPAAPPRREP